MNSSDCLNFIRTTSDNLPANYLGNYPVNFQIGVCRRVMLNDIKGLELLPKTANAALAYTTKKMREVKAS
jgi:hypothetical protein